MCVVETIYPPLHRMQPHHHDWTGISILVAGAVEETADRKAHLGVAGSAVVKPAGLVHTDRFGPAGARILSVVPKPAFLREVAEGADDLNRYQWRHSAPMARWAVRLGRELAELDGLLDEIAEEFLIAWLNLVAANGEGHLGSQPPRWLETVRERMHTTFACRPGVRQLAREVGVHPIYFARAFRRHFRCTVHDYVRRLRVLHAAEMLASDLPLVDVALKAGFADQAHFCRVFKRETGMTPLGYRQRAWAEKR